MKNKVVIFFVLILSFQISYAQLVIRKISPSISQPGQKIAITLKTPANFHFSDGASIWIEFIHKSNGSGFPLMVGGCAPSSEASIGGPPYTFSSILDTIKKYEFFVPINRSPGLYDLILKGYTSYPNYSNFTLQTISGGLLLEGGSVGGKIFYDTDGNGVKNGAEVYLQDQSVKIMSTLFSSINSSDQSGTYNFNLAYGTYTVTPILQPNWQITSSATSFVVTVSSSNLSSNKNFGLTYTSPPGTIVSSFSAFRLRCNSTVVGYIDYHNTGGLISNGTIKISNDPLATVVGFSPIYDSMSGDTLIWNVNNLSPREWRQIKILFKVPNPISNSHYMKFVVKSQTANTIQNYTYRDLLLCSLDPNDKTLYAAARVNPDTLSFATTQMEYQVRFQNTGNDTAYVVMVRDTLDPSLDFNSLQFVSSSHNVSITKYSGSRALLFRFNNINLTYAKEDSAKSQGYIKFLVTRNASLPEGTIIQGKANIFFDLNPAIITNTVRTTFSALVTGVPSNDVYGNSSSGLKVYPNPASNEVFFHLENDGVQRVMIFDLMGNKLAELDAQTSKDASISLEGWNNSSYYYRVIGTNGKTYGGVLIKK